jgi:hypothetical protein
MRKSRMLADWIQQKNMWNISLMLADWVWQRNKRNSLMLADWVQQRNMQNTVVWCYSRLNPIAEKSYVSRLSPTAKCSWLAKKEGCWGVNESVSTIFNIKFGVDCEFDEDISPWQDPYGWKQIVLVKAAKDQNLALRVFQMKEAVWHVEGWRDGCVTVYVWELS